MRKCEKAMIRAVETMLEGKTTKSSIRCADNTVVRKSDAPDVLCEVVLHGHVIARYMRNGVDYSFCGWWTRTTASRLRALLQDTGFTCYFHKRTPHFAYTKCLTGEREHYAGDELSIRAPLLNPEHSARQHHYDEVDVDVEIYLGSERTHQATLPGVSGEYRTTLKHETIKWSLGVVRRLRVFVMRTLCDIHNERAPRVRYAQWCQHALSCIEDGKVAFVSSGMDCDCVKYQGHVCVREVRGIEDIEAHIEHEYSWADGPLSIDVMKPSMARGIRYSSRDLALEAYEDGHPHVVYA